MLWQLLHIRPEYPANETPLGVTVDLQSVIQEKAENQTNDSIDGHSLTGTICSKTRIEYLLQSVAPESDTVIGIIQCRLAVEADRVYLLAADSIEEALSFTGVDLQGLLSFISNNKRPTILFLEVWPNLSTDLDEVINILTDVVQDLNVHIFIGGDGRTEPAYSRRLSLGSVFIESLLTGFATEESADNYPIPRYIEPLKLLQEMRKHADDFHKALESKPRPIHLLRGQAHKISLPAWPQEAPAEPESDTSSSGFDEFGVERIEFYFNESRRLKRYADYNSMRHRNLPTGSGRTLYELVKPSLLKKQGALKRSLPITYSSLELSEEQRLYLQADDHFWRWQARLTDSQNCQEQTVWSLSRGTDLSDQSWSNLGQKFQVCFMVWQAPRDISSLESILDEHFTSLDEVPDFEVDGDIQFDSCFLSGDRAWQLLPTKDGLGIYSMLGAKPWPDFLQFAKTLTEYIEVK